MEPIVYAVVARGTVVLAEYTYTSGNFPTITRVLLSKIPMDDGRMTYIYDDYAFHCIIEDGLIYLCLADDELRRRVPFKFLDDVKERFKSTFSRQDIDKSGSLAMNQDFSRVLKRQMSYYTEHLVDGLQCSQGNDVSGLQVANIEKLLQRGEKIELLVDRGAEFNKAATHVEHSNRNLRMSLAAFLLVGLIFFMIIMK